MVTEIMMGYYHGDLEHDRTLSWQPRAWWDIVVVT